MNEWRAWPEYARDRHTLSVHEAAHLVVGLVTSSWQEDRRAVVYDTDDGAGGQVEPAVPGPPPTRTLEEALAPVAVPIHPQLQYLATLRAATYLAGYAAEARLHGFADQVSGPPSAINGSEDARCARIWLRFAWPDERIRPMWRAWTMADALTKDHWAWIRRVAAVIAAHGECDTATAQTLCCKAISDSGFCRVWHRASGVGVPPERGTSGRGHPHRGTVPPISSGGRRD